jgi:tRNA(Leu) C34 or U34 (ribose-2'-O)-methylase TrmL
MAIEEAINIKINADAGAKSLSELKKEFKETQKTLEGLTQGSKEYIATLQKLGGIKDDIGDLNTTIKAFNPEGKIQAFGTAIGGVASGFQAAQGAAALFGQEGEALQKTLLKVQAASALADGIKGVVGMGDAFKVLGAIVKANPIFLIIGVITAITGALFALKEKVSFIGDAFEAVGEVIGYVIDKGKEFLDWIGVTSFALDDMRDSIQKNNELIRESMTSRYDTEIRLAKAAGENTMELELAKQKAIKETTQAQIDSLKRKEELNEDEKKKLKELQQMNLDAVLTTVEIYGQARMAREKQQEEETKKYQDELRKRTEAFKQAQLEADKINAEADAYDLAKAEKKKADQQAGLDAWEAMNIETDASIRAMQVQRSKDDEAELENKKQLQQQSFESTKQLVLATQAITDLVFQHQLNQAQGNAKKEREIKKKQFRVNKAFGIVNSIIDGVGAVQKALNNPYPLNLILAIASGIMATANTVKIATTKFDDGGGGAGGGSSALGGSLGSAGGGVALSPPSTGSTQLNPDGSVKNANLNNQPVKAFVTETDITKSQKRVNTIEERSKL